MVRKTTDLEGCVIAATDGNIGRIKDIYFDDEAWVIRYFVVDTGAWLSSRKVLISPIAVGQPNWAEKLLPVAITKEQVKNSPAIDTEKPAGIWGQSPSPSLMLPAFGSAFQGRQIPETNIPTDAEPRRREAGDPHLRSCKEVMAYHIHATDGDIGRVQSMLVDEETWAIRYLVVNTSNWWLDHQVLIAPQWIQNVSWPDAMVTVDLTREAVKDAPPYDSAVRLERQQEARIYKHYRRGTYWADDVMRDSATSRQ